MFYVLKWASRKMCNETTNDPSSDNSVAWGCFCDLVPSIHSCTCLWIASCRLSSHSSQLGQIICFIKINVKTLNIVHPDELITCTLLYWHAHVTTISHEMTLKQVGDIKQSYRVLEINVWSIKRWSDVKRLGFGLSYWFS